MNSIPNSIALDAGQQPEASGTLQQLTNAVSSLSVSSVMWKFVIPLVGLIVLLIVIYLIFRWYQYYKTNEPMVIDDPTSSTSTKVISGDKVPLSSNGVEFTYSFWIYVRDWSKNLGTPKCVMYRGSGNSANNKVASPSIWLYPNENKLMIRVSTYPGSANYDPSSYPTYPLTADEKLPIVNPMAWKESDRASMFNTQYVSDISNIPLQKWVHVTVSLWNTTMDVYINGKLVRSSILPGVPVNDATHLSDLYIGGAEGAPTFNGYFSKFQYKNRAVTPDEAMKTYLKGPFSSKYWFNTFKAKLGISLNLNALSDKVNNFYSVNNDS